MSLHIGNISGRLLSVELADGRTLHLAPGETSPEVDEVGVGPSTSAGRLVAAGLLTLSAAAASPSAAATRSTTPTRKTASTRSQD
ncbi:hypothetical protein ACN27J_16825 [Solwaraspora sp. WMMB762]|uniref:hypothetical protein n=1 Tax=Solwaraspora sp. WMMB762 TaxID=3404120 RepID=UPI003B94F1C6